MARIPATSALVLLLQVTVLILVFSTTANCLSLDDRSQMKQLEDYVRNYDFIFDCESFFNFKPIVRTSYNKLPVRFQIDNKIKEGLAAKDARLEELEAEHHHQILLPPRYPTIRLGLYLDCQALVIKLEPQHTLAQMITQRKR